MQGHSKGDLLILYIFEGDNKDVTAVDAGLISKDEYYHRHPSNKPKN